MALRFFVGLFGGCVCGWCMTSPSNSHKYGITELQTKIAHFWALSQYYQNCFENSIIILNQIVWKVQEFLGIKTIFLMFWSITQETLCGPIFFLPFSSFPDIFGMEMSQQILFLYQILPKIWKWQKSPFLENIF